MGAEQFIISFLTFLILTVLVAYAATKLRMPYTIAMVLVGLGLSVLRYVAQGQIPLEFNPDLVLIVFLPGLLFEASYHIDLSLLRANLRTILVLAIPGVLLSTIIVGFLTRIGLGLSPVEALLFGVIISATDPVAVTALFKELGVDKRLGIIVEGESLFNDGVAIVGYTILAGLASGSGSFSLAGTAVNFVVSVAGGATFGLVLGVIFGEMIKRTDDPLIDMGLTVILAYGTYLLAEETLHGMVSPVIAVVVAGIVVGNYGARGRHSATSTTTIVTFWEFVVFCTNSAVFLLIGLEIDAGSIVDNLGPLALAIGAILVARAIVVYGSWVVVNRRSPGLPRPWAHTMFWGGMRGAVSIALALSIPRSVGARGQIVTLVLGYVLFSVLVQGLTIRPLLRRLGLTRKSEKEREFETALAEIATTQAAASAIDHMRDEHLLSKRMADHVQREFEGRIEKQSLGLFAMIANEPSLAEANLRRMQREIHHAQKQALLRLMNRGMISEEVYDESVGSINERARDPSAMDGFLIAQLRAGMDKLTEYDPDPEGHADDEA